MQLSTDIQLTEDQSTARQVILDRLNMGIRYVRLTGHAGSGKTFLVSHLVEELQTYGYTVYACAPTHKAAHVLGQKMPIETTTIHSFLGLQLRRNNRDGGYMLVQKDNVEIPREGVVVLDEASMVGTQLWKYIDRAPGLQWLMVGDPAQLPPVAEKPSPALDVDGAHLHGIVRQAKGNPILRMAQAVREGKPYLKEADYNGKVGVAMTRDSRRFMEAILRGFREEDNDSPPEVRILTYRNDVVAWYNDEVRKEILGTDKPPRFAPGDWLMMNNTYFADKEPVCKNSEEVQVQDVQETEHVTSGGFWKVHMLTVRREDGKIVDLPVLHHHEDLRFKAQLGKYKDEAIKGARPWPDYYDLIESFADCSHCYAMTIHKCVSPDTLVETPKGLQRISEIPSEGLIAGPRGMRPYKNKVANPSSTALKITTKNGFQITVTPEHGLDVWNGDSYVRLEASEVDQGHFLRFRKGATGWPTKYATLPFPPSDLDVRAIEHPTPSFLTEDVAEFLGMMVADGTIYKSGFRYVKRHRELVERFRELCEIIFEVQPNDQNRADNAYGIEVNSVQLSRWLLTINGLAPNEKDIPEQILRSPLSVQQAFVRGLIEDGGVNLSDGRFDHVELSQSSADMLRTLQVMLLRMGIVAHFRKYNGRVPRLYFYGSEAAELRRQVGFTSHEKARRLALCEGTPLISHRVPVSAAEIDFLRDAHPNCFKAQWQSNDAKIKGYFSRLGAIEVSGRLNGHAPWLNKRLEYHHEKVVSIEKVVSPSMCVEVPDGHQFFQNGCVGWNSQGSTFRTVFLDHRDAMTCRTKEKQALVYVGVTRPSDRLAMLI